MDVVRRMFTPFYSAAGGVRCGERRFGGGKLPLTTVVVSDSLRFRIESSAPTATTTPTPPPPTTTSTRTTFSPTTTFTRGWHGRTSPNTKSDKIIIYAFGPDRPGLVSELTKAVMEAHGNVEAVEDGHSIHTNTCLLGLKHVRTCFSLVVNDETDE